MDSTTKWLLRGSAGVVIAVGGTGIFTMVSFLNKSNSETKVTMDIDKIRNTGNKCPVNFAYVGGGYCQQVICGYDLNRNDPRLGGKGWKCRRTFLPSTKKDLLFGEATIRAVVDERCPQIEPEIGRNNSCQNGMTEKEIFAATDIRSGKI